MLPFLLTFADEPDRNKIDIIYKKYNKIMYAVAYRKLSGRSNAAYEAEEAVQNAFVKIIKYIDSVRMDEDEDRLTAYFTSIATNEAINIMKKRTDDVSFEDLVDTIPSDEDFLEGLCLKSEYERVKQAIMELDDEYRIVLLLRYAENMKVSEIAAQLGIGEHAVWSRLRRGKLLLQKMLKQDD